MRRYWTGVPGVVAAVLLLAATTGAAQEGSAVYGDIMNDPRIKDHIVGDKHSGYVYATVATRDMQEDDFKNPAFTWVGLAEDLWGAAEGTAGKSCADCHGAVETLKGVSLGYPKYRDKTANMAALEHVINECRTERMGADAWKWESDQMLGMTAHVKLQSRGMPIDVAIDGPARPFFEKGREFYFQRRGQLDLSCNMCHLDNAGNMIRADLLSHGMGNGFPTYRLKWQKLGSLHRRFTGCNKNIRAEPFKRGSEEYTNLELFVMWRSNGLPSEAPSVRR